MLSQGLTSIKCPEKKRSISECLIHETIPLHSIQKKPKHEFEKHELCDTKEESNGVKNTRDKTIKVRNTTHESNGIGNAKEAGFIRKVMGLEQAKEDSTKSGFKFSFDQTTSNDSEPVPLKQNLSVFVGGMPYSWTKEDVHSFWSECGEITELECLTFHDSGRFKGIAKITYRSEEAKNEALACNGETYAGFSFVVNDWKQKDKPRTKLEPIGTKVEGFDVLFLCNLPLDITETEVCDLFSEFGIESVRLNRDSETGEFKGYAHVHFGTADHRLEDAIAKLDGAEIGGRIVRIGYAIPGPNWKQQKSKGIHKELNPVDFAVQDDQYLILLSGLHLKTEQEDIEELFKGAVFDKIVFLWNSKTKAKTGSLYLLLSDLESVRKVLKKNRTFHKGHRLRIRPGQYSEYLKKSTTKTPPSQKESTAFDDDPLMALL